MGILAIRALLAALGLIVSAVTRLNVVVLGRPVSVPWLGIVAVVLVLTLVALILHITRVLVKDGGLRLRPRVVQL